VHNVLAQTEGCPHHNSIQKAGLLEGKLTPMSLKPEVCHYNLCLTLGGELFEDIIPELKTRKIFQEIT
jgi:hypothetical protein